MEVCMTKASFVKFLELAPSLILEKVNDVILVVHGTSEITHYIWDGAQFCAFSGILA